MLKTRLHYRIAPTFRMGGCCLKIRKAESACSSGRNHEWADARDMYFVGGPESAPSRGSTQSNEACADCATAVSTRDQL
jgi:hypothetical protein